MVYQNLKEFILCNHADKHMETRLIRYFGFLKWQTVCRIAARERDGAKACGLFLGRWAEMDVEARRCGALGDRCVSHAVENIQDNRNLKDGFQEEMGYIGESFPNI